MQRQHAKCVPCCTPEKLTAPQRELKAKIELVQNQEVPVGSIFSLSGRPKIAKPVRTSPELVIQHPVFGSQRLQKQSMAECERSSLKAAAIEQRQSATLER